MQTTRFRVKYLQNLTYAIINAGTTSSRIRPHTTAYRKYGKFPNLFTWNSKVNGVRGRVTVSFSSEKLTRNEARRGCHLE